MPLLRLALLAFLIPAAAFAGTYSDYNSFNTQLVRAFAVPEPTYTYKTVTTTTYSTTSSPNSSSSSSGGLRNYSPTQDSGNSWAMPIRQQPATVLDPIESRMFDLVFEARHSGLRPDVTKATESELATFYMDRGVRRKEAFDAAYDDYREGTRILNAEYDQKQASIAAYQANEASNRAAYDQLIRKARAVALKQGDLESAEQWFAMVYPPNRMWNGSYIDLDRSVVQEAAFHAGELGMADAIFAAWKLFRVDDPAGFVWRNRAANEGSLEALQAILVPPAIGSATNFRMVAGQLEWNYRRMPTMPVSIDPAYTAGAAPAHCAHALARMHALGDTTLPVDAVKALEWALLTPALPHPEWESFQHVSRADTLPWLEEFTWDIEVPLREAWLDLEREYEAAGLKSGPTYLKAQCAMLEIFSGWNKAFPRSRDPELAEAALQRIKDLAKSDLAARLWLLRLAYRTEDWALGESVVVGSYSGEGAYLQGLFWRNRRDGKADVGVAIYCLEKARMDDALDADGYLLLADCYAKKLDDSGAMDALRSAPDRLGPYELGRVLLPLALMNYKRGLTVRDGDIWMDAIRDQLPPPKTAREHAFLREFEYQSVVAPFLKQYKLLNGSDLEIAYLEDTAAEAVFFVDDKPTNRTPEQLQVWLALQAEHRAQNAQARRELFAAALPKIHALVLLDHAEAKRLWSWVVLSGQIVASDADKDIAKAYLFEAAKTGDLASMNVLGESLFREAGALRDSGSALEEDIAGSFAEAADWLDAAYQNGSLEVRWPLVEIYRDGLGREKAPDKVIVLLQSLAAEEDKDAMTELEALQGRSG